MRLRTIAAATLTLAATASVAIACSVPVFRYALEHWRPESYRVLVFHKGNLTNDQLSVVDSLQPLGATGSPAVNLNVKVVDLSTDSDVITQQVWLDHRSESLPWMVVQSPPVWSSPQTIWQGELNAGNAAIVMNSPTRMDISNRLIAGESAVWLLLECGQKEADDKAFNLLTSELRKLETKIQLPKIETKDLADLSVTPDVLKVAFSVIRVSRNDPAERALVEMLLRVESDLLEEPQVSQPMAFPVFGRGRALYALVGDGIAPDVIEEACVFLTGECQCEVKAENPGVDLILNVDWDTLVVPTAAQKTDRVTLGNSSGSSRPDGGAAFETIPIPKGRAAEPVAEVHPGDTGSAGTSSTGIGSTVLIVLVFLAVGAVIATLFLTRAASR